MGSQRDRSAWRTSSHSSGGACVQLRLGPDSVMIRNSRDPEGAVLVFDLAAFKGFLEAVRAGEFDDLDTN